MRRVIISYSPYGEYSIADATGVDGPGIVEIAEEDWREYQEHRREHSRWQAWIQSIDPVQKAFDASLET